jgi:hypothetical protein
MKLRILSAALATAGLLGFASQAAASGFILTFQGVVSTGSDDTNIFGLGSGASLVGQGISESFVVDYAGGGNHNIAGAPYFRDNIGGTGFITSAVTINGVTTSVGSETGIDDRTDYHLDPACSGNPNCKSGFSEFTGDESFVNTPGFLESWNTFGGDFGQNLNYHPSLALGPPVFTAADNLDFFGSFTISHELFDQTHGVPVFDYETTGMFTADRVTITTFGGVPEPAGWALMIAGFGATGAALRRRRSAMARA